MGVFALWTDEDVTFAASLSRYAHRGQVDRAGMPYYLHPAAVAEAVSGNDLKIIAYLHDVLEDTTVTEDSLRNLFGDELINIVILMTRSSEEPYMDYIRRIKSDPSATAVKIADLRHNMDLSRLPVVEPADLARREKYVKALEFLQGAVV